MLGCGDQQGVRPCRHRYTVTPMQPVKDWAVAQANTGLVRQPSGTFSLNQEMSCFLDGFE